MSVFNKFSHFWQNWSKEGKIDYVQAEHAPEERLVAPIPWATLSARVVASPASHAALEVGGLSVHSFGRGECACLAVATAGCKTEQESRQTEAATC